MPPSLNAHGVNLNVKSRESAAEDVQHVADGGAGGTRDDGDALRQHRDRLLTGRIEKALLRQLLLELLERQLQSAQAGRLHGHGVELELPFLLVERQAPADDELQSVLDSETKEARIHRKQHDPHLGAGVFDRKIKVSSSRSRHIGRFTLDADVVVSKELQVDLTDQLAHLPDPICHSRMVVK